MAPDLWPWAAQLLPLEWLMQPPEAWPTGGGPSLEVTPIRGEEPMRWWAAGLYEGGFRGALLGLRRHQNPQRLRPVVAALAGHLRADPSLAGSRGSPLLVPVPSWKRRPNPIPALLARQLTTELGWPIAPLLARSRPVLGQHRLNRELRWANQAGAFRCLSNARADPRGRRPVLLLDDILTTGATACSAGTSLREAGWRLHGLVCLGRTPERRTQRAGGRDLRSPGR